MFGGNDVVSRDLANVANRVAAFEKDMIHRDAAARHFLQALNVISPSRPLATMVIALA